MGFKFASSWVRGLFNSGSADIPSVSFAGDENTGIYSPGADQVGIATAGTARMVADSAGRVIVAHTDSISGHSSYIPRLQVSTGNTNNSGVGISAFSAGSGSGYLHFNRSKSSTVGTNTVVTAGDSLGIISFSGADGTNFVEAARVDATAEGTPSSGNVPGYLRFLTRVSGGALTERMRLDNAGLITGTGTSLGAWTSYTPTLGGFTAGSGTPTSGQYCQIGKMVHFRAVWTFGSGSAAASARPTLTLPSASQAVLAGHFTAYFFDTSAGAYYQAVPIQTSTTVVTMGVQGALGISDAASTTSPFTWATGDTITLTGTYEIA